MKTTLTKGDREWITEDASEVTNLVQRGWKVTKTDAPKKAAAKKAAESK